MPVETGAFENLENYGKYVCTSRFERPRRKKTGAGKKGVSTISRFPPEQSKQKSRMTGTKNSARFVSPIDIWASANHKSPGWPIKAPCSMLSFVEARNSPKPL